MPRARKNNVVRMPNPEADAPRATRPSTITNDDIARRAFEIYERRGGTHGADLDDWLQAEQELRREASTARQA